MNQFHSAKKEALNGSLRHLAILHSMVLNDDTLLLDVLPVIYHYLPAHIPDSPSPIIDRADMDPAHYIALAILIAGVTPAQLKKPRIFNSLKQHWAVTWKWCRFFIQGYVDKPKTSPAARDKLHSLVFALLVMLATHPNFTQILGSTPGFIPLITRVWRAEIDWFIQLPNVSAAPVLLQVFSVNSSSFDLFVASAGTSPAEVASLAVQRVIAATTRPQIPCSILRSDFMIISHFGGRDDLLRPLLAVGCIPVITQAMAQLTSHTIRFDDPTIARACLQSSVLFLASVIGDECAARAADALDGRVLLSMFKIKSFPTHERRIGGQRSSDSDLNEAYTNMMVLLTPYLIYRSVLLRAAKSLKTIRRLNLEQQLESVIPKTESFWPLWNTFKDYVADRLACKDETWVWCVRRLHVEAKCENPSHRPDPNIRRTMLCQGCKSAYFCSVQCQRLGWQNGHRDRCRRIAADLRSGTPPRISDQDNIFMHAQLKHDLQRNEEEIANQKAAWPPSEATHADSFVIEMGYTEVPLHVDISPSDIWEERNKFQVGQFDKETLELIRSPGPVVFSVRPDGRDDSMTTYALSELVSPLF